MKVQVKRAFEPYSFFCYQKNPKKAEMLCMKFPSTPNSSADASNLNLLPPFSKNITPKRINKMVKVHSVNCHPSPAVFTPKIYLVIFL